MTRFKLTVFVREGESAPFPYLPVVKRPEYLNAYDFAIFPLNYAMRVWYWLLNRDRGAFDRHKPFRVGDLRSANIEKSLIQRRALTGEDISPSEAIMDALHRSNKLYAAGIDNHRFYWLLDDIHAGRIQIETPLERTIDEVQVELDEQRTTANVRLERQKGG